MPGSARPPDPGTASSPLHVAMVIQRFRPSFSGQAVQVEQLCRVLARRGVRSTVLTAVRRTPGGPEILDGWQVRRLRADLLPGSADRSRLWMPFFALRVLLALARLRPDVVHVHGAPDALFTAALYGRMTGTPVIAEMTLLGDDDPLSLRRRKLALSGLRWWLYRRCTAWVAMSRAFLPPSRAAGLPEERVHLIPQGVDVDRFRPAGEEERDALRSALGLSPGDRLIAFLGSLVGRKGVDLVLRAWPDILDEHPDCHLLLAGRSDFAPASEEHDDLEGWLGQLAAGARRRVHLLGLQDTPERVLRAADLFLFPSRREGFGSAIIEAMSSGLPVVVSAIPGITDMILAAPGSPDDLGDPQAADLDGIVVAQEDAVALARAANRLLAAPGLASRIGEAARRRARSAFDLERVAALYLELYQKLATEERR